MSTAESADEGMLPAGAAARPNRPRPDRLYEQTEVKDRVRAAIATLPPRERRIIGLYYFGEVTMKQIGAEIGVNESRVSQLHARAMQRLRKALSPQVPGRRSMCVRRGRSAGKQMARATLDGATPVRREIAVAADGPGVVVDYPSTSRASRSKSASLKGLVSQRQPLSSRNRPASVPATSPVTKMSRRTSEGELAAIAR